MNKLYRLPLRMRSKPQQLDPRRRRSSPNLVVGGILVLGALFALAAMGLTFFGAFRHKAAIPKEVGVTPATPVASVSPQATEPRKTDTVMPLTNPNTSASPGSASTHSASTHSANDQLTSVPVSSASPAHSATPTAPAASPVVQKREQKTEPEANASEKPLSKAARLSLEKKRKEAERKRAHLEEMYQNHEISAEAYNKGKEEYKNEIKKYRNELKSGE